MEVRTLGQFLRGRREELDLSIERAADLCGLSYSQYYGLERLSNPRLPDGDTLGRIAITLKVTTTELLEAAGYAVSGV